MLVTIYQNYSKIIMMIIYKSITKQCNNKIVRFSSRIKKSEFLRINKEDLIYWKCNLI